MSISQWNYVLLNVQIPLGGTVCLIYKDIVLSFIYKCNAAAVQRCVFFFKKSLFNRTWYCFQAKVTLSIQRGSYKTIVCGSHKFVDYLL